MHNIADQDIQRMRAEIPPHLDADELIANALLNCADVPEDQQLSCFESTVLMYIDRSLSLSRQPNRHWLT